jgi:hypothetical protein
MNYIMVNVGGNVYKPFIDSPLLYICPHGCGVAVTDPRAHEKFHRELKKR